mmetsp:Transcript_1051/g.1310  ORF Transcript_1051/g.1310 Transcript_1051/m.1310 type:complete len:203 (-) Transcript_1051:25-633(-)
MIIDNRSDMNGFKIRYHFRGSWCISCRKHLFDLDQALTNGELSSLGIEIEAITSEPGGDDTVRKRLEMRMVTKFHKIKIRSDPDRMLLLPDQSIYTIRKSKHWETGEYDMVEPALVIFDANHNLITECIWSWKTMGYPNANGLELSEPKDENSPPILLMRPSILDFIPGIRERRPIELACVLKYELPLIKYPLLSFDHRYVL